MATKTDRILSYLPPTFRALSAPSALYAVVDAFGEQLLEAENSLAAMMLSHWVDHADAGAEFIADLNCFAALYGLAPRGAAKDIARFEFSTCVPVSADETVEEFRDHLKRYVRTFIEGTVTVQGILRVVAEALGLHIADSYSDMDAWWTPGNDPLVSARPRPDDAAALLFGPASVARGAAATAAQVTGLRHGGPVDLSRGSILRISVDGANAMDVDVAPSHPHVPLDRIAAAINHALSAHVATEVNGRLKLASPITGSGSRLEIPDTSGDAAAVLLGLLPLAASGSGSRPAVIRGENDLPGTADLSQNRFLRLQVDRQHLLEVDCAGAPPRPKTLAEIVATINRAFGFDVASAYKGALMFTSPTKGPNSSLVVERPAAQDAAGLFGLRVRSAQGSGPTAAHVSGAVPVTGGLDLSARSKIRVAVDKGAAVVINCAGAHPAKSQDIEIVRAINRAFGHAQIAALQADGTISLTSPSRGPDSHIALLPLGPEDATQIIFGLSPRVFHGTDEITARLTGRRDLHQGVDLRSKHLLEISVDRNPPVRVDLWRGLTDLRAVKLPEIAAAVNDALGAPIALGDGDHLILTSPTAGPAGSIAVEGAKDIRTRRFVTRAYITDEAAPIIFGFLRADAKGTPAEPARLQGEADLSRGVDLRQKRFLRITIDGTTQDFDFAKEISIPRGATLDEIAGAINGRFKGHIASHDGKHLILTSRASGSESMVAIGDPGGEDAFTAVFGADAQFIPGSEGTAIVFKGTRDLGGGLDLRHADTVKIGIGGVPPVEIVCAGADAGHTTLDEIVGHINSALQATVASQDRGYVVLAPPPGKAQNKLAFGVPQARDATAAIFGFRPPRSYAGCPPSEAKIAGTVSLENGVDLSVHRFLTLAVDDTPLTEVDCAAEAEDPAQVQPGEIVKAINSTLGVPVAHLERNRLVISARRAGARSSVRVHPHGGGYAGDVLFGPRAPILVHGHDPAGATIEGKVQLGSTVNLSARRVLRIAVDGAAPVDVAVAGAAPDQTTLAEMIEKINQSVPGLASRGANDRLVLSSPTTGETSSLEVLPLRALELIDFPPVPVEEPVRQVHHGLQFRIDNQGAADTTFGFQITGANGESGMQLVDRSAGRRIRIADVIRPGEMLAVSSDNASRTGLRATIIRPDGATRTLPDSSLRMGSLGGEAIVPFPGEWPLTRGDGGGVPALLQLNDPGARAVVTLRAVHELHSAEMILVKVAHSAVPGFAMKFDVTLRLDSPIIGRRLIEKYVGVDIGRGPSSDSIVVRLATRPSQLVTGVEFNKADALALPRGAANFEYMNCHESRFDAARFPGEVAGGGHAPSLADETRFAGGICREWAVFDVSRFADAPPEDEAAFFGPPSPAPDPAVTLKTSWTRFQPGAFQVNLPAGLDDRFGARFDEGRLGISRGTPEQYNGVVTEPAGDPDNIIKRINGHSALIAARLLPQAAPPPGWEAQALPFINPRSRHLTGGSETEAACIYLSEEGVKGLIELRARLKGVWGNSIAITAKRAGTVRFDVTAGFDGARFENAREIALAGRILGPNDKPLAELTAQILKPSPVGVIQAKAAGVLASVTRDRTDEAGGQAGE